MKTIEKKSKLNPGVYSIPGIIKKHFDTNLNKSYTFNTLIKGDFNRMAINAGTIISKEVYKSIYQPFLIFGKSGIGKTHILNAIGNQILELFPNKKPFYINANQFKDDCLKALRAGNKYDFVKFYQSVDVLIIDEIEILFGAEKCQDIFFHIFNGLFNNNKQIIISSSLQPAKFNGIDQKLSSRLKWGLSVEINLPDYETRIAILRQKILSYNHNYFFSGKDDGLNISSEILEYIASHITDNIRELEGALISLFAQSILNKKEITLDLAKTMIDKLVKNTKKELSIDYIQKAVCDYFNLSPEMIHVKTRKREIVQARQIAMYFSKNLTKSSLVTIGAKIGGKDHATVLHACTTVNNLWETDKRFRFQIEEIEKKLK
jgi:chromosomal replication initiator protein